MEVVTRSVLVTRPAFFGVLQESAGGLGRDRGGTLQRDSNNVPVTGKDVCSDLAEIRNRVSSQNSDDDFRDARKQPKLGRRHDYTGRLVY